MTNSQLYLAVGLPIFAIGASLIVSLVQISGIRGELSGVRDNLRELRGDMKLLTGKVYGMMGQKS
jgi:hypothetical protein